MRRIRLRLKPRPEDDGYLFLTADEEPWFSRVEPDSNKTLDEAAEQLREFLEANDHRPYRTVHVPDRADFLIACSGTFVFEEALAA